MALACGARGFLEHKGEQGTSGLSWSPPVLCEWLESKARAESLQKADAAVVTDAYLMKKCVEQFSGSAASVALVLFTLCSGGADMGWSCVACLFSMVAGTG